MLFLNPKLKLESVKREFPQIQITIKDLAGEASKEDIKQMILLVSKSEHGFSYLGWSKEKQNSKVTKFDYCEMIFQEVLMDQAEQHSGISDYGIVNWPLRSFPFAICLLWSFPFVNIFVVVFLFIFNI